MIKLGDKVKDKVTGFTGIATAKCEYLNGCIQFCVMPKMKAKDGKHPDGIFVDQGQLDVVGAKKVVVKKKRTGGPMSNTPSTNYRG